MTNRWIYRVRVKHLFTREDDGHEAVQASMTAIADVLKGEYCFFGFHDLQKFYDIPKGDSFFEPVDYANVLIGRMYDYADDNGIWIE